MQNELVPTFANVLQQNIIEEVKCLLVFQS